MRGADQTIKMQTMRIQEKGWHLPKKARANARTTDPAGAGKCSRNTCSQGELSFSAPLGSFQGVDFRLLLALGFQFNMGREITMPCFPLHHGIRVTGAEPAGRQIRNPSTSLTLFHDRVTGTPVVPTASFCHEGAVTPRLQG
jgi:hypothetical protein